MHCLVLKKWVQYKTLYIYSYEKDYGGFDVMVLTQNCIALYCDNGFHKCTALHWDTADNTLQLCTEQMTIIKEVHTQFTYSTKGLQNLVHTP